MGRYPEAEDRGSPEVTAREAELLDSVTDPGRSRERIDLNANQKVREDQQGAGAQNAPVDGQAPKDRLPGG